MCLPACFNRLCVRTRGTVRSFVYLCMRMSARLCLCVCFGYWLVCPGMFVADLDISVSCAWTSVYVYNPCILCMCIFRPFCVFVFSVYSVCLYFPCVLCMCIFRVFYVFLFSVYSVYLHFPSVLCICIFRVFCVVVFSVYSV